VASGFPVLIVVAVLGILVVDTLMAGAADDKGLTVVAGHPHGPFGLLLSHLGIEVLRARIWCTSTWSPEPHSSQVSTRSHCTSSDRRLLQMRVDCS
jgi:hypothetical protein